MLGKTIAIDFDGVIHNYDRGWQDGVIYGDAMPGAMRAMIRLMQQGYEVVIFTTRVNPDLDGHMEQKAKMLSWLTGQMCYECSPPQGSIPDGFSKVDEIVSRIKITSNKPPAVAYIDDRGIRFTDWSDILKYFQ
jgi:5'(3')-deoxyribonucleotidase